jgi:hypothetical protein
VQKSAFRPTAFGQKNAGFVHFLGKTGLSRTKKSGHAHAQPDRMFWVFAVFLLYEKSLSGAAACRRFASRHNRITIQE